MCVNAGALTKFYFFWGGGAGEGTLLLGENTVMPSVRCQSIVWKCVWHFLSPKRKTQLTGEVTSMVIGEPQQND